MLTLDTVRNEIAANERVAHARGAHRLSIGDHRGAVQQRFASAALNTVRNDARQLYHVVITWRRVGVCARYCNKWLEEVLVFEADCTQHRSRRRTLDPVRCTGLTADQRSGTDSMVRHPGRGRLT